MPTDVVPTVFGPIGAPPTSKSRNSTFGTLSQERAPTDPIYLADVDVKNMVVGSRWMLGYDNNGVYTELDSGTCTVADFTILSVPAYASPFLLELRVRKSSSGQKYEPLKLFGFHSAFGTSMYVSQQIDPVAT